MGSHSERRLLMRSLFGIALSALIGALAGCSPATPQDELVDESSHPGVVGDNAGTSADAVAQDSAYFGIAADLRKCAYPMCGGWFLKSLNESATKCPDGRSGSACYTPELDWSEAN